MSEGSGGGGLKAVVINESTGEIELIEDVDIDMVGGIGGGGILLDTSGGTGVSHEVEVVSVEDFQRRHRTLQQQRSNITSTTQSIVKPLVSTLLPPSASSSTAVNPLGGGSYHLTRSTPTLLRNSRFARQALASQGPSHILGTPPISRPSSQGQITLASQLQGGSNATIEFLEYPLDQIREVDQVSGGGGSIIQKFDSGEHQLIVYNCEDNAYDVIPEDQLQICGVIQSEDGNEDGGQEVVQVIGENGEFITEDAEGRTIYICQEEETEGGEILPQYVDSETGEVTGVRISDEMSFLQDEEGNYYEVEELPPGQHTVYEIQTEESVSEGKKKRKVTPKRETKVLKQPGYPDVLLSVKKRPTTELKCLEPDCYFSGINIGDLRRHLTSFHAMVFEEEVVMFDSYKDFKIWRESYERERMVSFIFRGGTKKISKDQAVTYLICHRSGHYKPTMKDQSLRKRRMKPQGSCKMNGYCTAGIKLLKNIETGEVRCEICHTHYGHPLDSGAIPHLRANNVVRKIIWRKFEEGLTFHQVVQYLHHNPDRLEGIRLLDRRAIRNLFDKFKKNPGKSFFDEEDNDSVHDGESGDISISEEEKIIKDAEDSLNRDIKFDPSTINTVDRTVAEVSENISREEKADKETEGAPSSDESSIDKERSEGGDTGNAEKTSQPVDTLQPEDKPEPAKKRGTGHRNVKRSAKSAAPASVKTKKAKTESIEDDTETDAPPILDPEEGASPRRSLRERKPKVFADDDAPPPIVKAKPPSPVPEKLESEKKSVTAIRTRGRRAENKNTQVKGVDGGNPPVLQKMDAQPSEHTEENMNENLEPPTLSRVEDDAVEESAPTLEKVNDKDEEVTDITTPEQKGKSLKGRRRKSVKSDFDGEGKSVNISEELQATIQDLLQHGESGPTILMYKKPGSITPDHGIKDPLIRKEDFILIVQTPVQRQLLQMFPDIVNIDGHQGKPRDLKLTWILVLDEYREAIPAAWLISNVVDSRTIEIFLKVLHAECGELPAECVMAPSSTGLDYSGIWSSVFESKPRLLLNEDETKRDLRVEVADDFADSKVRRILNGYMNDLMYSTKESMFTATMDKITECLETSDKGAVFLKKFKEKWVQKAEEWSLLHQIDKPVNTLFVSDSFGKLKKFISFKGTKMLSTCVDPILKIGYDKCFARSKRMFKGDQKLSRQMQEIEIQHSQGCDIRTTSFENTLDGYHYLVKDEEKNIAFTVLDLKSPCRCKFVCPHCTICVHKYMCSCVTSCVNHQMCPHIHFVHMMISTLNELPATTPKTAQVQFQVLSTAVSTKSNDTEVFTVANSSSDVEQTDALVTVLRISDHEMLQVH